MVFVKLLSSFSVAFIIDREGEATLGVLRRIQGSSMEPYNAALRFQLLKNVYNLLVTYHVITPDMRSKGSKWPAAVPIREWQSTPVALL